MSENSTPEIRSEKRKVGRPRVNPEKRKADKDMLSETVACRVTKSQNIAIQFTADYFGLSEADWIRTVLLANVIQKGKPLPDLNSIRPGQIPTPISTTTNEN